MDGGIILHIQKWADHSIQMQQIFINKTIFLSKTKGGDEFGSWFTALLLDFTREKNLQLVGVHRPSPSRMWIGFDKLLLENRDHRFVSIGFLLFSISDRLREEDQLKVPDFDGDLSLNPVAGDDVFIFYHPIK